jgi:ATP-dependent Clp protease ATP-binding subunit ClpC
VVFHQLTQEQIITMVDLMITRVEAALANKDMAIELTAVAKGLLARRGWDPVLGARPLRRTIQREIEDQLSEKILFGEEQPGQVVIVDARVSTPTRRRAPRRYASAPASDGGAGHNLGGPRRGFTGA